MNALPIFAAVVAGKPPALEVFVSALPHFLGMLVVLLTLSILWGLCVVTGRVINRFFVQVQMPVEKRPEAPAREDEALPVAVVAAAVAAVGDEDFALPAVPPEIVVVVAAAVDAVLGTGHRVVAITPQDSNWEKAGRQSVLASHRIR